MNLEGLTLKTLEDKLRSRRYSLNKRKANTGWSEHGKKLIQAEYDQLESKINELKGYEND